MSAEQQTLPGLNDYLEGIIRRSGDMEDLSEEKHYSAERLLISHPDRYKIARALFFELGLSKRGICDICKLNSRTLNAIIEREINSRGAAFLFERVRRRKALIAYQLTEALEDLANDPEECKKIGINGLLQAIKLIQDTNGSTIDAAATTPPVSSNTLDDQLDYEKLHNCAISHGNGLDSTKNLALCEHKDGSAITDETGAESLDNHSILPSNGEYCSTNRQKESSTNVQNNSDKTKTTSR